MLACSDQIFLDSNFICNVAEFENTANDALVKILGQRLAFEHAIIDDFEHAATAGRAVFNLIDDEVENPWIVLIENKTFGNLSHSAEAAVHVGDIPLAIDDQSAVIRRLECRAEL